MRNLSILIVSILLLGSCNLNRKSGEKIITVSIPPQKFFVEQIVGDDFSVNVMLPPGASPASYEPSVRQMQELNNSLTYFYIGHLGFEKAWMKRFSETAADVNYISCGRGLDLLRGPVVEHGDHKHYGTDPHIWTSPENVKTITKNMFDHLVELAPDQADKYEKNLQAFIAKIDTLDNAIRGAILSDTLRKAFMIFHPSLGYYARDYHLEQFSIEYEGKSPSTAHMAEMVNVAKDFKISTIFVQTQFETSKAEAVAREIGAKVVTVNPLNESWLDEMYSITGKLAISFDEQAD